MNSDFIIELIKVYADIHNLHNDITPNKLRKFLKGETEEEIILTRQKYLLAQLSRLINELIGEDIGLSKTLLPFEVKYDNIINELEEKYNVRLRTNKESRRKQRSRKQ
jgi:hypothetical protein